MEKLVYEIAKVQKVKRFNAIINALKNNNIDYSIQELSYGNSTGNIIVKRNNNLNSKKIVITAHYDNAFYTPGANDNAAGCAILLNLIINNKNKEFNFEYVFMDLEEKGFIGSKEYINANLNTIEYAICLDMVGIGNNIVVNRTNLNYDHLSKLIKEFNAFEVDMLPPGDAYSFMNRSIPTLYIINSTDHDIKWYKDFANGHMSFEADFLETMHKTNDTPEKLNYNEMEQIYKFIMAVFNNN